MQAAARALWLSVSVRCRFTPGGEGMFERFKSFFVDGATFDRVISDAVSFGGSLVAASPVISEELTKAGVAVNPKVAGYAAIVSLIGSIWSARKRQTQDPPSAGK